MPKPTKRPTNKKIKNPLNRLRATKFGKTRIAELMGLNDKRTGLKDRRKTPFIIQNQFIIQKEKGVIFEDTSDLGANLTGKMFGKNIPLTRKSKAERKEVGTKTKPNSIKKITRISQQQIKWENPTGKNEFTQRTSNFAIETDRRKKRKKH